MAHTRITSEIHPMKHIVVVGAGPIGLFVALRLKQIGVKDVVLVDKRAGQYARSGNFEKEVFTEFEALLKLPIPPSAAHHIKDVERALITRAKTMDIPIYKSHFETFANGKMILADEEKSSIACDVVIDCTGTARAVIKKINELRPDTFQIQPAGDIPHKSYMLVRGTMDEEDLVSFLKVNHLYFFNQLDFSDPQYEKNMEQFRRLGWTELAAPFAYCDDVEKAGVSKVNLYMQAPDECKDQMSWLNAVLAFYIGHEKTSFQLMHESKKHPEKQIISQFDIAPCKTSPAYFMGEEKGLPIVVTAGDAMANLPFLVGASAREGAARANDFIGSLRVVNGEVVEFNVDQYRSNLRKRMEEYDLHLARHSEARKKPFEKANQDHYERLCKQGLFSLKGALDEKKGFAIDKKDAFEMIETSIHAFEKALVLPRIKLKEKLYVQKALLDIARRCRLLAKHFLSIQNYPYAAKYFKKALELSKHFPGQYIDDLLKIYSDLIIVASLRNDPEEAVKLANIAQKQLFPHMSPAMEDVADKIIFNQASQQLKIANQVISVNPLEAKELIEQSKKLISGIIDVPAFNATILMSKAEELEKQLPLPPSAGTAPAKK